MGFTYQDARILEMRHLIVELTQASKDALDANITDRGADQWFANLQAAFMRGQAYLEMLKKGDS